MKKTLVSRIDPSFRQVNPVDPVFLREIVARFHAERLEKFGRLGHVRSNRFPGPASVQLRSNDYLAIAGDPRIGAAEAAVLLHSAMAMPFHVFSSINLMTCKDALKNVLPALCRPKPPWSVCRGTAPTAD